jgi:hypothetical protein
MESRHARLGVEVAGPGAGGASARSLDATSGGSQVPVHHHLLLDGVADPDGGLRLETLVCSTPSGQAACRCA